MSENIKTPSTPPFTPFQVHVISSSTQKTKLRDSPTLSILKTPTLYFGSGRNSSRRTRKLKFANGPIDLESIRKSRDGSHDSIVSTDSSNCSEDRKAHNGQIEAEESFVEVAVSPKKSMKVSPESWTAFLEYKKFNDYANETEKTDYTYSRLSKYRHKEIIPGFRIRPNLSRSPLGRSTNLDSSSSDYSYSSDFYASFQYEKGLRYRVKSLNLDSEDEVDISTTNLNQSSFFSRVVSKVARVFIAIYVSISNYVASAANNVKYYFQKYILRRKNVSKYSSTSFWVPYSPAEYYYSPSCYSEPTSYFTRFRSSVYRSHERIATFVHVASQTVIDYVKAKHSGASRRRKLLWLFLPFLLLAGLFIARSDSFPNPEAILNTTYVSVKSIPSYVSGTVPSFFTEAIPNFFTATIPHFVTVSLPYFFTESIPDAFRSVIAFVAGISNISFLTDVVSNFYGNVKSHFVTGIETTYDYVTISIEKGYSYSSHYLIVFYTYFCTRFFELLSVLFNCILYCYDSVVHATEVTLRYATESLDWLYGSICRGGDWLYSNTMGFFAAEEKVIDDVVKPVIDETVEGNVTD